MGELFLCNSLTSAYGVAVIMDVFTRGIRGCNLGQSLDQELTLTALERALVGHVPEIHHSDQGVQYAATAYVDLLVAHGVAISMAEVGQAWQNGYAERVTLAPALQVQVSALSRPVLTGLCPCRREEEVDLSDY